MVSIFQWFIDGRANFTGPRLDIDALQNGEVVGIAPGDSEDKSGSGSSEDDSRVAK